MLPTNPPVRLAFFYNGKSINKVVVARNEFDNSYSEGLQSIEQSKLGGFKCFLFENQPKASKWTPFTILDKITTVSPSTFCPIYHCLISTQLGLLRYEFSHKILVDIKAQLDLTFCDDIVRAVIQEILDTRGLEAEIAAYKEEPAK